MVVGDNTNKGGKGSIEKQDFAAIGYKLFHLKVSELGCRYVDEFSFNDNQDLGVWKYDLDNPEYPERFKWVNADNWYSLSNSDFKRLKSRGMGIDFIAYSSPFYYKKSKNVKFFLNE